ncbi:unnamed protein product [Peniophora sp. CBMAI 1063]|nr:unnamed protein product [Peniophora sp. CBMAI 1063]
MGRFTSGDDSRPRKRPAGGFLTSIQAPKLSSSTFLTPLVGLPLTFTPVPHDDPRPRKRHAGGFLSSTQTPKLSSSTFLTPPVGPASTFTFVPDSLPGPPALAHREPGGKSVMLDSTVERPSAEELAYALKKPFHGIRPEDAEVKEVPVTVNDEDAGDNAFNESVPEGNADSTLGVPKPVETSFLQRLRKRCTRYNESKGFYERVTGADLGIRIQLMHRPGEVCNFRSLHSIENFTVIHTNGIHKITVDFCQCELGRDIPYHIQLMRWRLWPATCDNPQTATTYEALDLFTRLSVLGRLNVYDFYRALEAATDAAKLKGIACVRQQLSICARQFRHIMMFKRAGRGHEPGGIDGTPSGGCAIVCPACPNFKFNVSEKEQTEGPLQWINRVIWSIDANFRLSNKMRCSTKETDPHLTNGKAYMAPWADYEAHTAATVKELAKPAFATFVEKGRMSYAVPKFHLYAHKVFCQLRFAFQWLFGTAITDGEAPERLWSGFNAAVSSLRELGPGGNHDMLDYMFGAWNYEKSSTINSALLGRMDRALDDGEGQTNTYTDLTAALRSMQPEKLVEKEGAVKAWDSGDKTKMKDSQCPYYTKKQSLSMAQIKSQSNELEASHKDKAVFNDPDEEAALAECIRRGMRIEDERARIDLRLYQEDPTEKQVTSRTEALKALVKAIIGFRAEQEACMPSTYAVLTDEERDPDPKAAMTVQLCMPSDPPDGDESYVTAAARIVESRLRWEAMVDELDHLLHQLRLKGCLHKHRVANITGQHMSTRAQSTQAAVNTHIKKAADAYRRHRAAYLKLVGKGTWEETMRELQDSDCRSLGDKLIEQIEKMSEKRVTAFLQGKGKADTSGDTNYKLPWIWYNWTESSDDAVSDELMAEWAKSRARAMHHVHEVRLVDAEMQRVLNFNETMAQMWDARRDSHESIDMGEHKQWACDDVWADGMRAYASKQAFIRRAQAEKWSAEFAPVRAEARRFLAVHTDDGLAIDPSTILTTEEIEVMEHQIQTRRERRKKAKRPRPAKADASSQPEENESENEWSGLENDTLKSKGKGSKARKQKDKVGGKKKRRAKKG